MRGAAATKDCCMNTRYSRLFLDIRLISASLLVSAGCMQSANATIKSMSDSQMQSEHISLLPSMLVKKKKPKQDDCVYDKKRKKYISSKKRAFDDEDDCKAAAETASDVDDEGNDDDDADKESDKKQKAKGKRKGNKSGKGAEGDDDGNLSVKSQQEESDSDSEGGSSSASGEEGDASSANAKNSGANNGDGNNSDSNNGDSDGASGFGEGGQQNVSNDSRSGSSGGSSSGNGASTNVLAGLSGEMSAEDQAMMGLSSSYGGVNVTSGLVAMNAGDVTNDVVAAAVNFQNNQMLSAMSSTSGVTASTLDQVALNELNKSPYSALMTGRNPDGTVTLKSGDFKQQQFETLYLYGTITNRLHEGLDYEIPSIEAGTREIKVIVPAK